MYVPSAKVIERLMENGDGPHTVHAALLKINGLRAQLRSLYLQETAITKKHREDLAELQKERVAIQMNCEHYESTFHPDAAGGSDSHTTCNICDAEL